MLSEVVKSNASIAFSEKSGKCYLIKGGTLLCMADQVKSQTGPAEIQSPLT